MIHLETGADNIVDHIELQDCDHSARIVCRQINLAILEIARRICR
jgi:hypothetical protein